MPRPSLDEIFGNAKSGQLYAPSSESERNAVIADVFNPKPINRPSLDEIFSQPLSNKKSDADKFREFGAQDPDFEYGDILPFKRSKATGEAFFALPEVGRSVVRGVGDLIDIGENQSIEMTPDALAAFGTAIPLLKGVSKSGDFISSAVGSVAKHIPNPIDLAVSAGKNVGSFAVDTTKAVAQPAVRKIVEEALLKDALGSDVAKEGRRLSDKLGVEFTAGELSGNSTVRGIEDTLANSPRWSGKFAEQNQRKTDAIIGRFKREMDKISPEAMSRTDVGDRISAAYGDTLNNLISARRTQARVDFGGAKGKEETILSNNLFRELQAIKEEGNSKLLTKSKAHAARLANSLLGRVSRKTGGGNEQADLISLDDMANGLSDFSAEAARPGGLLDNAQSAAERRVYARLYGALQKDLDQEIDIPKGNPERVAMLAIARDNYKNYSKQISDIEKTAIGKLVGKADYDSQGNMVINPEKIADRMVGMAPTELKNTLVFLDKNNPVIANESRRYILETALRSAKEGVGQRGQGTTKEFAKAEFVKRLPDDETLNVLFKDKKAADDIRDIASAVNRMVDYGASQKGSQTFQRGEFAKLWSGAKGLLFRAVVDDTLAEDLLTPGKRRKIAAEAKQLKSPKGPTKIAITPQDKLDIPKVNLPESR